MKCIHLHDEHHTIVSIPDVLDATVTGASGKVYRFEFDERFGPTLIGKSGKLIQRAPGERHEFWPAFEAWFDARQGRPPKCAACRGQGVVAAVRLTSRTGIGKTCPDCGGSGRGRTP